jgi:hypothetical protein
LTSEEELVVSEVRDLMTTLDRVKRSKARVAAAADFTVIILVVVAIAAGLYLAYLYLLYSYGIFIPGGELQPGESSSFIPYALAMAAFVVAVAGIIGGTVAARRRLKGVVAGAWENDLKEGFPGAVKIMTTLDWSAAEDDIQAAKLGTVLYALAKVAGYTLGLSAMLYIGFWFVGRVFVSFGNEGGFALLLSFVLVLAASAGDLERKIHESFDLDALLWEQRWLYADYSRSEFKA